MKNLRVEDRIYIIGAPKLMMGTVMYVLPEGYYGIHLDGETGPDGRTPSIHEWPAEMVSTFGVGN